MFSPFTILHSTYAYGVILGHVVLTYQINVLDPNKHFKNYKFSWSLNAYEPSVLKGRVTLDSVSATTKTYSILFCYYVCMSYSYKCNE